MMRVGQQPGAPVDERPAPPRPGTSGTRNSSGQSSPTAPPTSAPMTAQTSGGLPAQARAAGDLGVGHLVVGGLGGLGHGGDQPRHEEPERPAQDGGDDRAERGSRRRPVRRAPARPPRASRRPGRGSPVNSSNWTAAWCTSRSSPPTEHPVADRRRQRRRPRVVDDLEDGGYAAARADQARGPARPPGSWRRPGRRRSAVTSSSLLTRDAPGAPGWARSTSTVSKARSGERTTISRLRTPRSASASPIDVAVAPPPRITAVDQRRGRALADGRDRPGDVGVVARRSRSPSSTIVLAAPARRRPLGELVDQRHGLALERHGQRQAAPVGRPGSARKSGKPAGGDPVCGVRPVQAERVVARPVQRPARGSARSGHRAPRTGAPSAGVGRGAVLRRTRPCSRGTRRRSRRTWSHRSPGRP